MIGVAFQVGASVALVVIVLVFMWRMPRRGEAYYPWAPPMALGSVWIGLLGVLSAAAMFFVPSPDAMVIAVCQFLAPISVGLAVLVFWVYRGADDAETILLQRLQAKVGLALGVLAVAVGYAYVLSHKAPLTPIGSP